jgi:hypothetical protein
MFEKAIAIAASENESNEISMDDTSCKLLNPSNIQAQPPSVSFIADRKKKYSVAELNYMAKRKTRNKIAKASRARNRDN